MRKHEALPKQLITKEEVGEDGKKFAIARVITEESQYGMSSVIYFKGQNGQPERKVFINDHIWDGVVAVVGGDDSDDWTGKTVCLFRNPNIKKKNGELRDGISVRSVSDDVDDQDIPF